MQKKRENKNKVFLKSIFSSSGLIIREIRRETEDFLEIFEKKI